MIGILSKSSASLTEVKKFEYPIVRNFKNRSGRRCLAKVVKNDKIVKETVFLIPQSFFIFRLT